MLKIIFYLFFFVFFACNSETNPVEPTTQSATPVTKITMGLSGVSLDLSDDSAVELFKNQFKDLLYASLNVDPSRIQILNLSETTNRNNYNIEFIFLESENSNDVSVIDLLDTLQSNDFTIETLLFVIEDVEFSETDSSASCEVMLNLAEDELVYLLNTIYSCPSGQDECHSESLDYEMVYNFYQEALDYCPESPIANFGAALTGMLTVTTDETLWAFYENWRGWSSNNENLFPSGNRNSVASFGLPDGINSFLIPEDVNFIHYLPISHLVNFTSSLVNDPGTGYAETEIPIETPDLEEFMIIIETELIDRLSNSINYLENIVDKDYTFMITPEMQNDPYQQSIEMDDTEFYLMKGSMHLARSILYSLTAYSVDINIETAEYDYLYLNQNSSFLTLRNQSALPNAYNDLSSMIDSFYRGFTFLSEESDAQFDDMIEKTEIGNFNANHSYSLDDYLNPDGGIAYDYLINNFTEEICSSSICSSYLANSFECPDPECINLTFNLQNFMQSPPNNLKEIVPNYTVSTNLKSDSFPIDGFDHFDHNLDTSECLNLSNSWWSLNYNIYNMESFNASTDYIYNSGGAENCSVIIDFVEATISNILEHVNIYGENLQNVFLVVSNYGASGTYSFDKYVPCFDWDANTYDEWTSDLDYTFGGLLVIDLNDFLTNVLEITDEDINPANGIIDWWDIHANECSDGEASEGP